MRYLYKFTLGGSGYALIEIVYRGFTHFSMFIAGGICFCILLKIAEIESMNFALKSILGGVVICAVEFVAGCVVNLWLNLSVWDYTNYGYHLFGQVCLRYLVIWSALSAGIMLAHRLFKTLLHNRHRFD